MPRSANPVNQNLNNDQIGSRERGRYHHGDLRSALIEAGERLLAERGVDGFSLREVARRAGVSPGAPAHHFGDARGLLTAIATRAFEALAARLADASRAAAPDRLEQVRAQGEAYVGFALHHPAGFDLMWRRALLDPADPALCAASRSAFEVLRCAVDGQADGGCERQPPSPAVYAAWSMVHGFARLALDGPIDASRPGLLDGVLRTMRL